MDPFWKAVRPSTTTSLLKLPVNGSPGELSAVLMASSNSTIMFVPDGTVSVVVAGEALGASDVLAFAHADIPIETKSPKTIEASVRLMSVLLI
jgi:hypothetical protein